jgi:hypothetical protein
LQEASIAFPPAQTGVDKRLVILNYLYHESDNKKDFLADWVMIKVQKRLATDLRLRETAGQEIAGRQNRWR